MKNQPDERGKKENRDEPADRGKQPSRPPEQAWLGRKFKEATLAEWAMVCFTLVIAATTVVYTIYSRRQWSALLESNAINRESLQSVQRAYISYQGIRENTLYERTAGAMKFFGFQFFADTLNSGNTPAGIIDQYFNIKKLPDEPTEVEFTGSPRRAMESIGPRAPNMIGSVRIPPSAFGIKGIVTMGTLRSELVRNTNIYAWGWITYRDVFPKTEVHLTEFCQQMVAMTAKLGGSTGSLPQWNFQFRQCARHNCADKGCGDYEDLTALGETN